MLMTGVSNGVSVGATFDASTRSPVNSYQKKKFRDKLKLAIAHLDPVELDGVWRAALRGDFDEVERRLARVQSSGTAAASAVQWRESSSWLFNRRPFRKRSRL